MAMERITEYSFKLFGNNQSNPGGEGRVGVFILFVEESVWMNVWAERRKLCYRCIASVSVIKIEGECSKE